MLGFSLRYLKFSKFHDNLLVQLTLVVFISTSLLFLRTATATLQVLSVPFLLFLAQLVACPKKKHSWLHQFFVLEVSPSLTSTCLWFSWIRDQQESEGVTPGEDVYIILRLDGRVRRSGIVICPFLSISLCQKEICYLT